MLLKVPGMAGADCKLKPALVRVAQATRRPPACAVPRLAGRLESRFQVQERERSFATWLTAVLVGGPWTFSVRLAERDNDGSRGLEPTDRGQTYDPPSRSDG